MDVNSLYVQSLVEALKQVNQYMALALGASVSALALESRIYSARNAQTAPPGLVPMPREGAQLVFIGVAFIAGLMASYAVEAAASIASKLRLAPDILNAMCTYPSLATAPILAVWLAAALPVAFVAPVFWRQWKRLHESGILVMFGLFTAPYFVIGLLLTNMDCRAS